MVHKIISVTFERWKCWKPGWRNTFWTETFTGSERRADLGVTHVIIIIILLRDCQRERLWMSHGSLTKGQNHRDVGTHSKKTKKCWLLLQKMCFSLFCCLHNWRIMFDQSALFDRGQASEIIKNELESIFLQNNYFWAFFCSVRSPVSSREFLHTGTQR